MMTATQNDTTPRAWVGCLACYNAGRLVGAWVDGIEAGEVDPDIFGRACWASTNGHEELWVFDHENYGPLLTGETSPIEAQRLAGLLESIDEDEREAFGHYVSNGHEPDPEEFQDAYNGWWDDIAEFAEQLAEDTGAMPDTSSWPAGCIDWERAGNELLMGDYWAAEAESGGIYVFRVY